MATTRPEAPLAPTLPGRYYCEPAIYELEQERIFSGMWVCVGRDEAIPNPGDYFAAEIGRESVIVLRGRDGAVGAFFNVCRHRGSRLCAEPRGHVKSALQCRYHAWSYGLDGRLLGAPNMAELEARGFDRGAYGLLPVAVTVWEGLVWLNLASDPEPIGEQLGEAIRERFGDPAIFARYRLGDLRVGKTIEYDVQANWKLIVENFMECYHCGPIHPELCRLLPDFRTGRSYQQHVGVGTVFADDVEAFTVSGKGRRPRLPGLLPGDDRRYYGLVLRPNVFVNLLPDHVIIHTLRPLGPERSHVTCDWLFDPGVMAEPDFDPMDAVAVFDLVNRQDWQACELVQRGMPSRAYRSGGVYVPSEYHIRAFNDFVLERLGEGEAPR